LSCFGDAILKTDFPGRRQFSWVIMQMLTAAQGCVNSLDVLDAQAIILSSCRLLAKPTRCFISFFHPKNHRKYTMNWFWDD
jgi:hypothetical protein